MFKYMFHSLKSLVVAAVLMIAAGQVEAQTFPNTSHPFNEVFRGAKVGDDSTPKPEPYIQVTPSVINMAIGATKEVTVELGDYNGQVTATVGTFKENVIENENEIAYVSEELFDSDKRLYVFTVTSLAKGETFLHLSFEWTDKYAGKVIDIPINVLNLYQYTLQVVNAPQYGVSIDIWGINYTASTVFNSSRPSISETDVEVKYLPSYSSQVSVDDKVITVTYSLKQPTRGSFLRLRNYSCGLYASLSADGAALSMGDENLPSIIYYDEEGRFLFYQNGQFVSASNRMAAVANAASASTFTFTQGTGDYSECFSIRSNEGKYLHGSNSGTTTGTAAGSDYAYWHVELLEALPVAISAAGFGYATLYSPVPLEIPGGMTAYYVDRETSSSGVSGTTAVEHLLHLRQLLSVIPAGTPVILVGVPGTTYDCYIRYGNKQARPSSTSAIIGHCATQVTASVRAGGTVFALQPAQGKEEVGFYPWTQTNLSGFKCYFRESTAMSASAYRLVFESDDFTTDLQRLPVEEAEDTAIYNLCGQRVSDSLEGLPAGIYIRQGKKIIIRK